MPHRLFRLSKPPTACKFSLIFAGIPALISRLILKLFSVEPDAARTDVTEKEILKLVDEGETSGALNSEEREMIENIFDFSEHSVREIMTHYMDVTAICEGTPDDEILKTISDTGYSRYPVYKNDIGSVTGILIAKEYLTDRLSGSPRPFTELVRAPLFVPESMQTDSVLREMKQKGQHMAIVVNEYGEACGVVTMEDLSRRDRRRHLRRIRHPRRPRSRDKPHRRFHMARSRIVPSRRIRG